MAVQAPYTALCRSLVFLMAAITGLVVAARWPRRRPTITTAGTG